jgi:hypothetical protein
MMAVKFETIKAGDTLYDCSTYGVGNTTMRAMGCWVIRVILVNTSERNATITWNGNPQQVKTERYFNQSSIRRFPPEWVKHPLDKATCRVCHRTKSQGHTDDCAHPKAVKERNMAGK